MNTSYTKRDYKYAKRNGVSVDDARYRRSIYVAVKMSLLKQGYRGKKLYSTAATIAKKKNDTADRRGK